VLVLVLVLVLERERERETERVSDLAPAPERAQEWEQTRP
jgi:hypothetical protein